MRATLPWSPDNDAHHEILRQNGYATGAFGKWHETPTKLRRTSNTMADATGSKFYGFLGAEENMYEPSLHDGVAIIDTPQTPDYHLLEDMTDQAIAGCVSKSMRPEAFLHLLLLCGIACAASSRRNGSRNMRAVY